MTRCTAVVTGRHRSPLALQQCPACAPVAPVALAVTPPTSSLAGVSDLLQEARYVARRSGSSAVLREVVQSGDRIVLANIAVNRKVDAGTLRLVHEQAGDLGQRHRAAVLSGLSGNPRTPEDVLDAIVSSDLADPADCMELATHPNASPLVLRALYDKAMEWQSAATARPGAMSRPMGVLFETDSIELRRILGRHPRLPRDLFDAMSTDPSRRVREGVARNPVVGGAKEKEAMARDARATVRREAARSPLLSDETFALLATDSSNTVRRAVASNPAVPLSVLHSLEGDPARVVTSAVKYVLRHRVPARLGLSPKNHDAAEYIMSLDWWTMDEGDPAVALALSMWPNP